MGHLPYLASPAKFGIGFGTINLLSVSTIILIQGSHDIFTRNFSPLIVCIEYNYVGSQPRGR